MASPASVASATDGGPVGARAAWLIDIAALCLLKAAIGAWILAMGFSHVSDDDYARTVIAEQFAHAPRLDPSGTSWLPLPFWIVGGAMMLLGRSLASARAIACMLGAIGVAAPYAAMRDVGVSRAAALTSTAIAMAIPWNAWLGVAMVPDGWTGALVAAGAIAMSTGAVNSRSRRAWAAAALLAASLSRYESWPVCALFVVQSAGRVVAAVRTPPSPSRATEIRREVAWAVVAAAGPVLWMAWNAYAHGSPVHFIARVTAFRRAIGAADVPFQDKLLGYPRALFEETPEVIVALWPACIGVAVHRELRRRWAWGSIAAVVVLAFLVGGDLGDGAPTHHPARALASLWWIVTGMGVDAIVAGVQMLRGDARRGVAAAAAVLAIGWCATLPARWRASPGRGASDQRDVQIARGLDLRARGVVGADITPCSFEHFALLAGWGEPERAHVAPRTGSLPTNDCPVVTER